MLEKLRVLRGQLLIRIDPDKKYAGRLALPDRDSIKYCVRCGRMAEALAAPCVPEDIFERDRHDIDRFRGQDRSHQIEYAVRDVVMEGLRPATVLRVGANVEFSPGDRVLVNASAGRSMFDDEPLSPYRVIAKGVIQARVED